MSRIAVSSFQVTGWEESPYDEPADGPRLARGTVRKSFSGDLEAESVAELLMCQADPSNLEAGAAYVASEVVTGLLHGRTGTFVMQHGAVTGAGVERRTFGNIAPGSGSGELKGLNGTVEISVDADGTHTLTITYELG